MKKTFYPRLHLTLGGLFLSALILLNSFSFSQQISDVDKNKIEIIARYAIDAQDNTDHYLERLKFKKPNYISNSEWNEFPSVRKIESAYKAALQIGQGTQFLEGMSKVVAEDYNSIKKESKLSHHFASSGMPDISYRHPVSQAAMSDIRVPSSIKREIIAINKYVDEGALGSMQSVFRNYMNLDEDAIYDVLSKSNSKLAAFEQGLARSSVPPPLAEKLTNMANDLQKNYKALQSDPQLSRIANRGTGRSTSLTDGIERPLDVSPPVGPNTSNVDGKIAAKGLDATQTRTRFRSSYTKYNSYVKTNYSGANRGFTRMRGNIGGFGGVIFGDKVVYGVSPKLIDLRWEPINNGAREDYKRIGYLELYFNDNTAYSFGPVLYEDVFAANLVVTDTSYKYGNGIGMVSIIDNSNVSYKDGTRRFGITLHPAISHLRLGMAFVVADALPSASTTMRRVLQSEPVTSLLDSFYRESNQTWKITDNELKPLKARNKILFQNVVLSMWGFRFYDTLGQQSRSFDRLLPYICNKVDEYKRVNDFSKVLAIFRWAKNVNLTVKNVATYNSFIRQPISIVVDAYAELKFNNARTDFAQVSNEKNYFVATLRAHRNDSNRSYVRTIDSVLTWITKITARRDQLWRRRFDYSQPESTQSIEHLKSEDTSGYAILNSLQKNYREEWIENAVKIQYPDSLAVYKMCVNKISVYSEYHNKLIREENVLLDRRDSVFRTYRMHTRQEAERIYPQLSPSVRKVLADIANQVRQIRTRETELLQVQEYSTIRARIRNLLSRCQIVPLASIGNLLRAEQKILVDYLSEE